MTMTYLDSTRLPCHGCFAPLSMTFTAAFCMKTIFEMASSIHAPDPDATGNFVPMQSLPFAYSFLNRSVILFFRRGVIREKPNAAFQLHGKGPIEISDGQGCHFVPQILPINVFEKVILPQIVNPLDSPGWKSCRLPSIVAEFPRIGPMPYSGKYWK